MKNRQCLFTALLMSLVMIVWQNMFLVLISDQTSIVPRLSTGPIWLQLIVVIKYVSISVVVMPGEVNLSQVLAGYLITNTIANLLFTAGLSYVFPPEMVIAQLIILITYAVHNRVSSKNGRIPQWQI